jgi:hypothetical protein
MKAEGMQEPQVIREEGPGGTGGLIVTFTKGPVSVEVWQYDTALDPRGLGIDYDNLSADYNAWLKGEVFTFDIEYHSGDHSGGFRQYGLDNAIEYALGCLQEAWERYIESRNDFVAALAGVTA